MYKKGDNMFKEWKAIFKKPTFIIVMIGISLIPALYNIIFLSSMWDPYGQLSELPVAVVNNDKEATYNGNTMAIGKDMVSNLKENKSLDFHFVNEEEGKKGLEDGDYYMVVTLPSDLSEKAASILTNHPEQMNIDYQTSSGHSFIASKMSDSTMTQLKQNVSASVTETYTKALFQKMGDLKSGLTKAADGSEQFTKGLTTYVSGVKQLNSGLGTFNDGLQSYTSAVSQVDTGLNQLSSKTPELVSGVNQLNTGMKAYAGGVSKLNTGLNQFSIGVNAYTSGVDKLSVGANQLSSQSDTLRDGITQLNKGIKEISTQLNTSSQQKEEITQLATSLDELNKALQAVTISDNTELKSTISNDLANISTLAQTIVTNNQTEQEKTLNNLQATATYQSLTDTQKKELTEAVSNNSNSTIESAKAILITVGDLKENLGNVNQPVSNLSTLQTKANQVLPLASTSLTTMSTGVTQLQNAVDNQLLPGSQSIETGVNEYTKGLDTISLGVNQLSEKNTILTTSLDQLVSGSTKLTENSSTLTTGLDTLAGKTPELVSGIEKLSFGSNQLNSKSPELIAGLDKIQLGSSQLTDKSSQLLSASSQLGNGAVKIADGAGKLAEGGATLTAGIGSLQVGVSDLGQGLSSASNQLKSASTDSKNAETLSEPLSLSKTDNDQVPVNGIAMAPYMISVALFVAALSTNMIFAKLPSGRHPENRLAWVKSRFEINGVIAVLAAVLVYGGVHLIGLTANHEMRTLFLTIIASLTFMAMVTALTTWNSRLGAFFSLILLLLQLASSAGTYPLALTNDFFKSVNPWLPMSYSVSGLRQTISMTGNIHHQVIFLLVTLVLFIVLGMLAYQPRKMDED